MGKFKISTDFIAGTIILLMLWTFLIPYWLFVVFHIGNPNLEFKGDDYAHILAIGVFSLMIVFFYTSIYYIILKEKIQRFKKQ